MAEARDTVLVGQSDQTPKLHMPRRDFLKVAGTYVGSAAIGGILRPDTVLPSEVAIPQQLLSGIGRIDISAQSGYGRIQQKDFGMAQVYLEDASHIVVVTNEHIGKGFFWKDINLYFPNGRGNNNIHVDGRIGAPGWREPTDRDWWIKYHSPQSNPDKEEFHPVRTLIIAKPKGFDRYVTPPEYGVLHASPEPKPGDEFIIGGFTEQSKGALVFEKLKFERVTKANEIRSAGIPLWQFYGKAEGGMSGGAIMAADGTVAALLSRGPMDEKKGKLFGIPFATYQPISEVLSVLKR